MKKPFSTELAYILGIIFLTFGTALTQRADFGMSMVVAPAYLVFLKVSQTLPWFTFGMAEICFQTCLILLLALITAGFRLKYLFSFVTAFFYSITLDLMVFVVAYIPDAGFAGRIAFFLSGILVCALGISMFFHTYLTPEIYELYVKDISAKFSFNINKVKTVYDCTSCLVAIIMSFLFFGWLHFEGVKLGTVVCALINGWLISLWSRLFDRHFVFKDTLKWRSFFEK